ncbi:unnamed protein product [Durusdinium trenchii]|uniref:Uncharacterized protein n=2 Tax=Durusdinium trenchii TaxID=1381693 RepID=A0ABP0JHC2_9DINO
MPASATQDGGADGSASSQAAQRTEDAQSQRVESELLDDGEALAQFHAKAKARRKNRQKRVQYQFLFKDMNLGWLLEVISRNSVLNRYKPAADNAAPAEAKTTKPNLASHDGLDSEL